MQEENKPVGVLETVSADGRVEKSSKRLFGSVMISAGGLLLVAIGVIAIFRPIADSPAALQAGQALIITGAALLGVGVLDGIGRSIGSRAAGGDK